MKKLNYYLSQIENEQYSNWEYSGQAMQDGFAYADASAQAAPVMQSCIREVQASDPYILTITNSSTAASAKAVIFGAYAYANPNVASNYGSDPTITITPASGSTYFAFLQQSMGNPLMVTSWRMDSTTTNQLNQTLYVNYTNAGNGKSARVPISLVVRRNLYYQNQNGLEFNYPLKIDGNTYLDITILPSGSLTLTMFPEAVADTTQAFVGSNSVKKIYEVPQLSVLPTIATQNAIAGSRIVQTRIE